MALLEDEGAYGTRTVTGRTTPRLSFADPAPVPAPAPPPTPDRAMPVWAVEDRRTYWEHLKKLQDEYNAQQQRAQREIAAEQDRIRAYYAGGDAPPLAPRNDAAVRFGQGIINTMDEYARAPAMNAAARSPELAEAYRRNVVYPVTPDKDSYYSPGFIQTDAKSAQHELTHAVYYEQLSDAERTEFLRAVFDLARTDPFIAEVVRTRGENAPGTGVDPQHIYTFFADIGRIPPPLQKFYSRPQQQAQQDTFRRQQQQAYYGGDPETVLQGALTSPEFRQGLSGLIGQGVAQGEAVVGIPDIPRQQVARDLALVKKYAPYGPNFTDPITPEYDAAMRRLQNGGIDPQADESLINAVKGIPSTLNKIDTAIARGIWSPISGRASDYLNPETGEVEERFAYRIPGSVAGQDIHGFVTGLGEEAARPTSIAAMTVPFTKLSTPIRSALANMALQGGANVLQDLALGRTSPAELGLSAGVGAAFGGAPLGVDAIKAGAKAAAQLAETPQGRAVLRQLASEQGAVQVPAPRVLNTPTVEYIDPPEIGRLTDDVLPNTPVKERPAQAAAKAEFETRGGVVRGAGRIAANAIERILTVAGDRPAQLGQQIRTWLSSEARRFDLPIREAVTRYWRDVTASRVWATEQGSQIGRRMRDTFGKPNDDFIGVDGQPVFFQDSTGANIRLTNRDAVENYHLFASRMTPEQQAAAQSAGNFIKRMREEARARGVRLGGARAVDDGEIESYVHRTVIEKDGTYFAEYGDVQRPGAKTSAEETRHYVTVAEGKKNGIRYSDSWEEEYIAHLAGLRRRMSDMSLKEWTDSLSETLTERMLRKYPTQAAAREAANTARADALRILKDRQAEIQKRYRARAQQKVREAQRATIKAQRALDKATTAPRLDDVRVKQANAMKIGAARERVVAATSRLDDALQAITPTVRGPNADRIGALREQVSAAAKKIVRSQDEGMSPAQRDVLFRNGQDELAEAQRLLDEATSTKALGATGSNVFQSPAITAARRALTTAQRQFDGLTTQQALQAQVAPRTKLIQDVGKAREALAAANRDLSDAANLSVDALWRRMDDADRLSLQQARADVEMTKNGAVAANKAWGKKAQWEVEHLAPTAARAPGGTALPITSGRIFEAEDAQVLRELAEDMQTHPIHPLIQIARLPVRALNLVTLTVDNSFFGVQGQLFFLTRPLKWAASVVQAPIAAASPRFRQRWLLNHMDGVRWVQKNLPEAFDANPDFIERGSILHKVGEKVKPIGYFSQLFNDARTMSAVYLAEGMKGMARNAQEEFDLGSSILKMVGLSRTVGAEQDVLLAARFFRSKLGLGFDALTNSGIQGRVARQQFARLMGTATMATLAYQYFVLNETDPKKLMESITPGRPNSFEVAGINLLGSFATEINTLGKVATLDNPADAAAFYGQSKLNFLWEGLYSGWRGENLIGQPTSIKQEFFSLKAGTPLSIQQAIHNIKYQDAPWQVAVPAAFLGIRYSPPTQYERLANLGEKYGVDMDNYFSEPGTRDAANREFPELAAAHKEWEEARRHGTVEQRQRQQIIDDARTRIDAAATQMRAGERTPESVKDFLIEDGKVRRTLYDQLPEDERDNRLQALYETYDLATGPTGELDFDKQQQLAEAILKAQPELRPIWEAQQYVPLSNDPAERLIQDARKLANQEVTIGDYTYSYWNVGDQIWESVKASATDGALNEYETADDFRQAIVTDAQARGVDPDDELRKNVYWKDISEYTTNARHDLIITYPEIAAALRIVYGVNLPTEGVAKEVQEEWSLKSAALFEQIMEPE